MVSPLEAGDPRQIGTYRLVARLGAGGMGQVYLGRSRGGRPVAIKVIRSEYAHDGPFRGRFRREVDAARRVGGHFTAQVVDADPDADPPWMVTAYIPGPSLRRVVTSVGPLPAAVVRTLGAGLAEGLAAIHAYGLIHRDVKPDNVVLGTDGPRLIDFGISRAADLSTVTARGELMGTVAYMAPEQINGRTTGPEIDVFALGGVLTYAATGHPPFGTGLEAVAVAHRIAFGAPDLTGLPDDLHAVVTGCLEKDPAQRPPLADVLDRLSGTGPAGGRLPDEVVALIDAVVRDSSALLSGGPQPTGDGGGPVGPVGGNGGHNGGPGGNGGADTLAVRPPQAPDGPPPVPPPAPAPKAPGRRPGRRSVLIAGGGALAAAVVGGGAVAYERATRKPAAPAGPRRTPTTLTGHNGPVSAVAFSRDGRTLASASDDATIRLWSPATWTTAGVLLGHTGSVDSVSLSSDGKMLASGGTDGTVRLWDAISRTPITVLSGHSGAVWSVDFNPGGTLVASGGEDHAVRLWDVGRRVGTGTLTSRHSPVYAVAFGPDGTILVSGYRDGHVLYWDVAKRTVASSGTAGASAASVTVSGKTGAVAVGTRGNGLVVWDGDSGDDISPKLSGVTSVTAVGYHPDGELVALGLTDGHILLWDQHTRKRVGQPLSGHTNIVNSVAFSPDGKLLASGSSDTTIRLWPIRR